MVRNPRTKRQRAPEYFCTTLRKVEPVGREVVRIYCSIEREGLWEDQVTILLPIATVERATKFVSESATEIHHEIVETIGRH